jgi:hypothetical protein
MTQSTEEALRFVQDTIRSTLKSQKPISADEQRRILAKQLDSYLETLKDMPARSDVRIHAGDLRALGVTLDERIPDCAWVPASSVHFDAASSRVEGDTASLNVSMKFDQPFKWIEVPIMITPARPE